MNKENKGLSLIALVVTIIILLILAGIALVAIIGDDGIMKQVTSAQIEHKHNEYKEILELAEGNTKAKISLNEIESNNYIRDVVSQIENHPQFKGARFERIMGSGESLGSGDILDTDTRIWVTTADNHSFSIPLDISIKPDPDDDPSQDPPIVEADIVPEFYIDGEKRTDNQMTNQPVVVKIGDPQGTREKAGPDAIIQYSFESSQINTASRGRNSEYNSNKIAKKITSRSQTSSNQSVWLDYNDEDGVMIPNNGWLDIRIYSEVNRIYIMSSITIDFIDKTLPIIGEADIGNITTNSIQISAIDPKNENDSFNICSGIGAYNIKKENDQLDESKWIISEDTNYTFINLEDDEKYFVYVRDKAGNVFKYPDLITTNKLEGTIEVDTTTWEENKAKMTLKTTSGFDIKYKLNGGDLEDYSEDGITDLVYGDVINAVLTDGNNETDIQGPFTPEDKINPTISNIILEDPTTNKIKVKVVASDEESGIKEYLFYKGTSADNLILEETKTVPEFTFEKLADDTTYYINVEVKDNANNSTLSTDNIKNTKTDVVTALVKDGNVTFECTPDTSAPRNVDISVKIITNVPAGSPTFTLQYCDSDPTVESNWHDYTTAVVVGENKTVYARFSDKNTGGTNAGDYATLNITCIDKDAPSKPVIKLSGTKATGYDYYNGDVTVTITPGTDTGTGASGVDKTTYSVSGSGTASGTYSSAFKIPTNTTYGTYTINATTKDKAGNGTNADPVTCNICKSHSYVSNNKSSATVCKHCSRCGATVGHSLTTKNTYTKGATTHAWSTSCTVCGYVSASGNHSVTSTNTGTTNNPVWKYTCSSCGGKDITNLTSW